MKIVDLTQEKYSQAKLYDEILLCKQHNITSLTVLGGRDLNFNSDLIAPLVQLVIPITHYENRTVQFLVILKHIGRLNIMVDYETLSLKPNAFLLECGMVLFNDNLEVIAELLTTASELPTSTVYDIDMSTLQWWINQGDGLNQLFMRGKAQKENTLFTERSVVDHSIDNWLWRITKSFDNVQIWSKGSLDANIIQYHCNHFKYHQFSDVSTIKQFAEMQGIIFDDKIVATHNALEDCYAQLEILKQAKKIK